MFESAALGRKYSDKEFEQKAPALRLRLFNAQRQCLKRRIPILIIVAGLEGSGRGAPHEVGCAFDCVRELHWFVNEGSYDAGAGLAGDAVGAEKAQIRLYRGQALLRVRP